MTKLAAKKILPKIGKHVKEKIAPEILSTALESGKSVLSREKNLKQAMKSGIKKAKKNILNISKTVLKDEIACSIRRGEPLWQLNEKTPEPNQEEYTCRVIKAVEEESKFLLDSPQKTTMFRPSGETVTACPSVPVEGEEVIPESVDLYSTLPTQTAMKSSKFQYFNPCDHL